MTQIEHSGKHTGEHIAPLTTLTPAQQHYRAIARGETQPTRCATPACGFNAKVGTDYCGNCHIARGTYWNTPKISTAKVTEQSDVASGVDRAKPSPVLPTESQINNRESQLASRESPPQSAIANRQSPIAASPIANRESKIVNPGRMRLADSCTATTRAGSPCSFAARRETGLCINHDPAYREQQAQHRRRGGQNSVQSRRQPHLDLQSLDLSTRAGIQAALETVVRLDLEGRLSQARTRTLVRSLALAARNFDPPSARDRRTGVPSAHSPETFGRARRRCLTSLFALLPPLPQPEETP